MLTGVGVASLVMLLERSRVGIAWRALGDNSFAAAESGLQIGRIRVVSFICGAALAGLAGALHSGFYGTIRPNDFGFARSTEPLMYLAIGGLRSPLGAIAGAIALTLVPELLHFTEAGRHILTSVSLIAIMAVCPRGLIGWRPMRKGETGTCDEPTH